MQVYLLQKPVQPDRSRPTDERHLRGEDEEKVFILEVRFPEGNRSEGEDCWQRNYSLGAVHK